MLSLLVTARLWLRPGRSERPHVFITGAPRSGTTLVKTILCAHPELGGGDYESTGIFRPRDLMAYHCGEISLPEMNRLVRTSPTLLSFYDSVADRLLDYHGGQRFVDKVWPGFGRLRFVPRLVPNARWLHVIRDGRDCYCSARHHPNVPQARSLDAFAKYWQSCIYKADALPSTRTFTVRYEALCREPDATIRAIMSFLEMETHVLQFDAAARGRGTMKKRAPHGRLVQEITTATVDRWRGELAESEHSRFLEIAGSTLERLGYLESSQEEASFMSGAHQ